MKVKNIFEAPLTDLPVEAKQQIAADFEKVSTLAKMAADAVISSDRKTYLSAVEELSYQVRKLKPQIEQR